MAFFVVIALIVLPICFIRYGYVSFKQWQDKKQREEMERQKKLKIREIAAENNISMHDATRKYNFSEAQKSLQEAKETLAKHNEKGA